MNKLKYVSYLATRKKRGADDYLNVNSQEKYINAINTFSAFLMKNDFIDKNIYEIININELKFIDALFTNNSVVKSYNNKGNHLYSAAFHHYVTMIEDSYTVEYYDEPSEISNDETCIEGARKSIYVNRYERSSFARRQCLKHHGYKCAVCSFSFEEMYGKIGKEFIHVHHIVPLSEIGDEYIVNPIEDLVPVCPNCHAMLHKKNEGGYFTIEELRALIRKKVNKDI